MIQIYDKRFAAIFGCPILSLRIDAIDRCAVGEFERENGGRENGTGTIVS